MKQGLPGQFFMPKSICEGTWGVCARVSVCVLYACVFGIALLPVGHTGGETRKSTRAPLPLFLLLPILRVISDPFPHKISMLIANGLSCQGPPGPQKGS